MSICKGKNKSGNPCKFKSSDGFEGYCKKCYKYKEIFENPDLKDVMIAVKDSKVILRNVIHVGVKECRIKK